MHSSFMWRPLFCHICGSIPGPGEGHEWWGICSPSSDLQFRMLQGRDRSCIVVNTGDSLEPQGCSSRCKPARGESPGLPQCSKLYRWGGGWWWTIYVQPKFPKVVHSGALHQKILGHTVEKPSSWCVEYSPLHSVHMLSRLL